VWRGQSRKRRPRSTFIVGVVAAVFDHWDSRAGEPQLDTRVLVMNWVQNSDGVWRTLDSRGLLRSTAALSEMYNGVPSEFVTSRGRQPSAREVLPLRHQAILQTWTEKHVRPLADLVDGWRGRAREVVGPDPVSWVETSPAATTFLAASRAPCRRDVGRRREGWQCTPGGDGRRSAGRTCWSQCHVSSTGSGSAPRTTG
jgi:hypothetical protein